MKILQTPVRFYPFIGGVEKYTCTLSRELVKRNHAVTVICSNEPESAPQEVVGDIQVKRLPFYGKVANTNISLKLPIALLAEECDLIHTHLPTPWAADWSAIVSLLTGKPLVLTYHNDIIGEGAYHAVATFYNLTLLKCVLGISKRIIITSSRGLPDRLKRYHEKVVVIPNCVDTEFFKPLESEKTVDIFFLGVLDEYHRYKGLEYLLDALCIIRSVYPDVQLVIGGTGNMQEYYMRRVQEAEIDSNVYFAGKIPDSRLVEYYNRSRIFVLASTDPAQEGFGIVLLEAMACNIPVISSSVTGIAEEIGQYDAGIIIEPKNTHDLAGAVMTLLGDEELRERMGAAGRVLVEEKYSCQKAAERMEELYLELL